MLAARLKSSIDGAGQVGGQQTMGDGIGRLDAKGLAQGIHRDQLQINSVAKAEQVSADRVVGVRPGDEFKGITRLLLGDFDPVLLGKE